MRVLRKNFLDKRLARLCAVRRAGQCFSCQEIADYVGVSRFVIMRIEAGALEKLKKKLEKYAKKHSH